MDTLRVEELSGRERVVIRDRSKLQNGFSDYLLLTSLNLVRNAK